MNKKILLLIASIFTSCIFAAEVGTIYRGEDKQEVWYEVTDIRETTLQAACSKKEEQFFAFKRNLEITFGQSVVRADIILNSKESATTFDSLEGLWIEQQVHTWHNVCMHTNRAVTSYQADVQGKPGHSVLAVHYLNEHEYAASSLVKGHKRSMPKKNKIFTLLAQRYQEEQKNKEQL